MPNMEYRFDITVTGEETGINWVGSFLYRRPSLSERSLIEAMRARLSGDLRSIDPQIDDFNIMISHLRWTLKEYPEWWKASDFGGNMWDRNVIEHIYKKCADFEEKFRKKLLSGNPKDVESREEPDTDRVLERASE
jgi:hypothetical protein